MHPLQLRLRAAGNPRDAAFLARFFKTGPGQYGEGDRFLGVRVPAVRKIAREFSGIPLSEVETLLHSPMHEERLAALVILVAQAGKADAAGRRRLYDFYLANTRWINNWDLVDVSAPHVVGGYLADRSRRPLHRLAASSWLWDRRIAVLSTFPFLRAGDFGDTLGIVERLLADPEDLLHKACGWMLREAGKRDRSVLEAFLDRHAPRMPRTMLRYAIEKLPERTRLAYLKTGRAGRSE